ncbi:serine hydrolase domain-containing protein [Hyphobacterium indicum]|uniref:serine hydrolase domain-containing protein n=1 Tax=Hyphobacterium indicum TaxID=2162714 RepID=UPI000D6430FB|nr:serine hydrolase domain-containing protein [Hyphobacterium indicum]
MKRIVFLSLGMVAAITAWIVLVFVATSEGWGRSALTPADDAASFVEAATRIVERDHSGNLVLLVLEAGAVTRRYSFSTGDPVDGSSVFQAASLGKWLTAWGVMTLVEDGAIDLDHPVSDYLTRWQLPDSEFDTSGVTVRRLLSHTAGLGDGLGYDGFDGPEDLQTLEESLIRARDASPGNSGIVELGSEPGSEWNYSGGGYTILQLLIEGVSGQSFAEFMSERVFVPLGMERTTFDHEEALRLGLAENYDLNGNTQLFRWYTALAATSLFTSADDLAIFINAQAAPGAQSVLTEASLDLMQTPHASQMGADIWGIGPMLYAPNNVGGYIIGHDGKNGPAINTVARLDPATGDGIVILSTGSEMLATQLAGEWVFWKTGNIDSLMFLMSIDAMLLWMGIGSLILLLVTGIVGWRTRKRRPA